MNPRPFISLIIITLTALSLVFVKMELRRMGYVVLKMMRQERKLKDEERLQMLELAKVLRPERLQSIAQNRLTMRPAEEGQIIEIYKLKK